MIVYLLLTDSIKGSIPSVVAFILGSGEEGMSYTRVVQCSVVCGAGHGSVLVPLSFLKRKIKGLRFWGGSERLVS